MSSIARALTQEDEHTPYDRKGAGSRLGVVAVEPAGLDARRARSTSRASSLAVPGDDREVEELSQHGRNRAVTPPPRKDSLDPGSKENSPELSRARRPSANSSRSSSRNGMVDAMSLRSSSVSPAKMRQTQPLPDDTLPPAVCALESLTIPSYLTTPTISTSPAHEDVPLPKQVRLVAPPSPHVAFSSSTSSSQASRGFTPANTLSVSSSNNSNATSNSSYAPPPPANPDLSPYPASNASFVSLDPEVTASLIQNLYARLEAQGVPGDGWDEGKERSRDGIINREVTLGGDTVRPLKGRHIGMPMTIDEEAKADHVLRRVDRYGFFSNSHPAALGSQHNRLATLSAAPFATIPSLNPSKRPPKPPPATPSSPMAPPLTRPGRNHPNRASTISLLPSNAISPDTIALETKRIDKWASMLSVSRREGGNAQDWGVGEGWWNGRVAGGGGGQSGKYRKLQRRVFKGVPDRWRRAVWGLMMEKMGSDVASGKVSGLAGQRVYTLAEMAREYHALQEIPSVQDVQIDLDVPRTISGHIQFHTRYGQGQRSLFHVLHAFGLRSEDIGGYCQGMGPIAATLLCYFEPERAYAGLCRLFDQYQLGHIFAPGFPGLVESFYVQEKLVELLMPDVRAAFTEHCISTSAYATKWYITLFANSVPFATQLRLWDGLLLEGVDFLVITALAIIWHFQHDFTSADSSFESILSRLSSYFFVESDDALLRWIRKTLRLKGLKGKMQAWRKEWQGFVEDGTSGDKVT
ncbi:hypothetical protein JCM11641_005942 [Rhodosporidiobolus odoratus]